MSVVHQTLKQDYELIFEAMRRLIEGTCCLRDDEQVCVWDLFGKLHLAFLEHVEFEEAHILPRLPAEERARHHAQHARLMELIEKARWELECAQGDQFRQILIDLSNELKTHPGFDGTPGLDLEEEAAQDRNYAQIARRAQQAFLT
jgi:hypothetical protein